MPRGEGLLAAKATAHFAEARNATLAISWLSRLARYANEDTAVDDASALPATFTQIENLEGLLARLGTSHDRKYDRAERVIREGLDTAKGFEDAHRRLGEHLGFFVGNVESRGVLIPGGTRTISAWSSRIMLVPVLIRSSVSRKLDR